MLKSANLTKGQTNAKQWSVAGWLDPDQREQQTSSFLGFLAVGKQQNGAFPPPTGKECGTECLTLTPELNVLTVCLRY